ncbi:hypothetical protein D8674_018616 [Pyrus ussuriensis x Pyrus communis]|uniref:Uncharacterized protein n=1 Tax=Pyrus ussuriensis x Pyrus communis TaxID=2448454 RepID=A0A5N5GIL3_9ROSA|nr:hypothetical protein D8674_018616 [Pyrus ussuriensis x Pyrus communis]
MKFLLELGSCYRSSSSRTRDRMTRSTHARSSKSGSGHQWKPALVTISEDGVVSGYEGNLQSEKMASAKAPRPKAKAPSFSYTSSDDFQYYSRRNIAPMIIPADFSATPFMF